MRTRVFIADDHGVLRGGLRALITAQHDMEVAGEAADGVDAVRGILETRPDVALLDISMPGRGGFGVITSVKRESPETRILVLTVHDEPAYVRAAIAAGAAGYVVKKAVDTELLAAIRAVAQGRAFMDHSMDARLAQESIRPKRAKAGGTGAMAMLSERERQVLALVARGYTNREAADELGLGVKSVETYRSRVMEKLGLRSRSDLIRFALDCGILGPGEAGA
jgi:two-component system, NarL family, response regulator NreC